MTSPLCFGQLSIWRSIETNPLVDGIRSQLTKVRSLPAGVTEAQVRAAVETLWRRHESLRTTFDRSGGEARQVVHASAADVVDFCPVGTVEERTRCAEKLFARPFDLTEEFAWRFLVLPAADGTTSLATSVHHILADAWALRLLFDELDRLLADPAAALPPPRLSPSTLARRQRSDEWAARRAAARVHWTRVTEDFADAVADEVGEPGERLSGSLDLSAVSGVVSELADRHKVSAQTVILTLLALGIRATTGRERMVVHLMVANRVRPEWNDLVTSMNQIVPTGIVVDKEETFTGLLRHVQKAGMAAMRNGCHDVDEASAITNRAPGSTVDHVLNYMLPTWPQPSAPEQGSAPTMSIGPSTRPAIAGIYAVVARGETPVLQLHVDSNLYPERRLRAFLDGTEQTLRLLSTRPDLRVADLITLY